MVACKSRQIDINHEINDFQFLHLHMAFYDGVEWFSLAVYASP